jgi:hypothetical protein
VATAILSVINIIGTGVGFVIPTGFVNESASPDKIRFQTLTLMLFEFGLSFIGALLIIFLFK